MVIRRCKFTLALMWAMIPLMAFAGLPRIGCICASGQHKFFCQRNRLAVAEERCSCCYGRQGAGARSAGENQGCSSNGTSCCGAKRTAGTNRSPVIKTDCPCRSVVDQSIVIAVAKVVLDLDQAGHTPWLLSAVITPGLVPAVNCDHARGDLPHPPDLVTTLGVLLI